jgi:hypothetical protein
MSSPLPSLEGRSEAEQAADLEKWLEENPEQYFQLGLCKPGWKYVGIGNEEL